MKVSMGMEWRWSMFISVRCFTLLLFSATHFFSSVQTQILCHADERSALLQFKESFTVDESASTPPLAYPKVASWTHGGDQNQSSCCSWNGVECDKESGHVIGLDLSSSCLSGPFNSNSSLFRLVHLQMLDLSDNDFNFSQIPSRLGHDLTSLTYLNLSYSFFSGQIPPEISKLSKLSILDMSSSSSPRLGLGKGNLRRLVQNMTGINQLHLSGVDMYSTVPDILVNASSLTSLELDICGLYGEFPVGIFHLPSLQILCVSENYDLNGYFPNFNRSNSFERLDVSYTNFSGELPTSVGNLHSLNVLDISSCYFYPHLPSSLRNLSQLSYLDISSFYDDSKNFSTGQLDSCPWSWVGKLTNFYHLGLDQARLRGEFPSFLANLTQLIFLSLGRNEIAGQIPSWLMKLNKLSGLDLRYNFLQDAIPPSLFQLQNLEYLDLSYNNLSGLVEFDQFSKLKKLKRLYLSANKLSVNFKTNLSATVPQFYSLFLDSCYITEFPEILNTQYELEELNLADNNIRGQVPQWLWNTTRDTLYNLNLGFNFLTGFEQNPSIIPWPNLEFLILEFNRFQGSLPIPPQSIIVYDVSNNGYSGELSPWLCNLNRIHDLFLYNNNLSGKLPRCLGNSSTLGTLMLSNNSFHGDIPPICPYGSNLVRLDLSYNQIQGKLPRSMANCTQLDFLNIGNNQMSDIFPSWLGALPLLWALILRSNGFHGMIGNPATNHEFPKLCIIDLSENDFSGLLPSSYIENWNSMKFVDQNKQTYFEDASTFKSSGNISTFLSVFSITIFAKGGELKYKKTPNLLKLIHLSGNRFEGEIPEGIIGNLKGLILLNLSNNALTGHIPSSLGDLTALESLDLSQNQLTGKIPSNLARLTFLEYFNVSHNHLWGPIPLGQQFATFQEDSYEGNSGLCGKPLSKGCEAPPAPSVVEEDEDSGFEIRLDWYVVLPGVFMLLLA